MHPLVLQIGVPPGVFATGLVAILGAGASLVLVAIFGDSIPRGIAYHHAGRVALWCLRPLGWFQSLLGPVATLLHGFTIGVLRIFSLQSEALPTEASLEAQGAEDLRIVFAQARRTGRIPEAKLVLLERMFGFSDTFVRQVMVPRVEVAYFDRRKALADNLDLAQRTAHSRYPLVDGSLDRVVGVVHMKDLFWTITDLGTAMSDQGPSASSRRHPAIAGGDILKNPPGSGADFLTGISRQVLFVPETMRLESLLREFQNRKVHMAMVVDEFGGVSGLVTFENVIEEIVGEVQDEFDMEQPLIRKLSDREWLLDGITPLDLANEALGLRLSSEEADTIGGFLSSELGRLPLTGESVNLDGVEFIIREVRRLRVQRVLARLPSPEVIGASEGP
jgi:putative hemolysin